MDAILIIHVHSRAVNPAAATPRARIVWKIRLFTARVAIAALVVEGLAEVPVSVPVPVPVVLPVALPRLLLDVLPVVGVEDDAIVDTDAESDDDETEDETEDIAATDVVAAALEIDAPVGGGLASAGFKSAPVPQAMA